MLEMLKNKSLFGLVLLFVGFTYIKTLPKETLTVESERVVTYIEKAEK